MTNEGMQLSVEQLQDVKDRLVALGTADEKQISSSVLVPFGPKAFFRGQLHLDKGFYIHAASGESQWVASREETIEKLRGEIVARTRSRAGGKAVSDSQLKVQTKVEQKGVPTTVKQASNQPLNAPFVEIREEVDATTGEVTKSQTVDVTKHLEQLQLHDEEFPSPPPSTPAPAEGNESQLEYWQPSPPPRGVNEEEHAALMQRFEELAKLEENTERNTLEQKSSARKLQSTGWKKGFLRSKPRRTKIEQTKTNAQKKVSFKQTDQAQKADTPTKSNVQRTQGGSVATPRSLIDSKIFTGNIVEKQNSKNATQTTTQTPKPKRMSRFSQERKEGLR